jgi:glycosyl transferase family 25
VTGRAFVLHLPRASARREAARALLASCGLEGEIWSAVDGSSLSSNELSATVGAGIFAPPYPFALKTSQIGCFLSHRQIWAEIVRRDLDYGLIFEDDAAIDAVVFARALALARAQIDDLGYIQFQTQALRGPARLIDTNGGCALSLPLVSGLRSTAQMVGRDAAAHLLSLTETFDRPVDCLIQSHWHTRLRPAGIYPSGVSRNAETVERKPPLTQIWARYLYRRAIRRAARHSPAPITGGLV